MVWDVRFDAAFDPEFDELPVAVQDELLAHARPKKKGKSR